MAGDSTPSGQGLGDGDGKCYTNHFTCDLSPHIVKISKIRAYFPPTEVSDCRNVKYVVFQAGAPAWEDVTFTFMGSSKSLQTVQDWVQKAYDGEECRKNISITLRTQSKSDVRTYDLIDCMPLHYTKVNLGASGSGSQTVVKLQLKVKVNMIKCA